MDNIAPVSNIVHENLDQNSIVSVCDKPYQDYLISHLRFLWNVTIVIIYVASATCHQGVNSTPVSNSMNPEF